MIQFLNTVSPENTANMTDKDCLDTLQRLQLKNSPATRAKLHTHQYLQEDNPSVVVVHGKQINDAVFIDSDKDKETYPAQYCNGGRWILPIIYFSIFSSTFPQVQFVTGIAHREHLFHQFQGSFTK